MHRRMHNTDFDILLKSVHYSPKLQIPKFHKIFNNLSVIYTTRVGCFDCHISSIEPKTFNSFFLLFKGKNRKTSISFVLKLHAFKITKGSTIK